MTICVVGGSGFIGTCLVRRLKRVAECDLVIVDKVSSRTFGDLSRVADVRQPNALRVAIPNGTLLINLAAEHRDDVSRQSLYDDVNVQGARNLCEVAREKVVPTIIFTSSVAVYGFAPIGTDETGAIQPFNAYGRTKHEAEQVFKQWQAEDPAHRSLTIIRPTVVFGENNRGNVYNLLRQIASGRFAMIGTGTNRKSVAYVENVAAFIEHAMGFGPGVHVFNYVDKPDFTMNELVATVRGLLGRSPVPGVRMPYWLGHLMGATFDATARVTGKTYPISAIRVKKFCADSVYGSAVAMSGFQPPVALDKALQKTIRHEFVGPASSEPLFYSD